MPACGARDCPSTDVRGVTLYNSVLPPGVTALRKPNSLSRNQVAVRPGGDLRFRAYPAVSHRNFSAEDAEVATCIPPITSTAFPLATSHRLGVWHDGCHAPGQGTGCKTRKRKGMKPDCGPGRSLESTRKGVVSRR